MPKIQVDLSKEEYNIIIKLIGVLYKKENKNVALKSLFLVPRVTSLNIGIHKIC